jgi:hypothetical protein
VYEGVSKRFRTKSVTQCTFTFGITRWKATQRFMAAKLIRLTHRIAIQLYLVAESCTNCSSRSKATSPDTFGYTLVFCANFANLCLRNHSHPVASKSTPACLTFQDNVHVGSADCVSISYYSFFWSVKRTLHRYEDPLLNLAEFRKKIGTCELTTRIYDHICITFRTMVKLLRVINQTFIKSLDLSYTNVI